MKRIIDNIIIDKSRKYFDFTASGLAYQPIEDEITKVLQTYANTHSNSNSNAILTAKYYDDARANLKNYLELDDSFCLLPSGTGASGAIKKFQELIGIYIPPKTKQRYKIDATNKPLVIIGPFEHHSNEISFREALCDIIRIPLSKEGYTDLAVLKSTLEKFKYREIIGSFSVASNVTGIFNPIEKISKLIKEYGGILALDGATISGYMNVDCKLYDAMYLSPHKLLGGVGGCGILVIKKSLIDTSVAPTFSGGGTVSYVSASQHTFLNSEELREDGGTPGILQLIRTSLAYKLRNEIGLEVIHDKEIELKEYFRSIAKNIDGLIRYCKFNKDKLPIFSFNLVGHDPYDVANTLSTKYNIDVRAGCSCAGPYGHDLLNLKDDVSIMDNKPGWIRVSLHYTHTKEDVDYLLNIIKDINTH